MNEPKSSISGFLNVDKPSGWTSSDVVAKLRSAFGLRKRGLKIGHGGTLDPMATGVLPICIGSATRLSSFILSGEKIYLMSARLGEATNTYDSEGEVTASNDSSHITSKDVESALPTFSGEFDQIPPMYSAIKKDGQPLYKLARQGKTIALEPRRVLVRSLELTAWAPPDLTLRIHCGSGFYARSLAHDLGQRLGCSAHMTSLRREQAGVFRIEDSLQLDSLIDAACNDAWIRSLSKPDHVLKHLNAVVIDGSQTDAFLHGREIRETDATIQTEEALLCVYARTGQFLGLAQTGGAIGSLRPKIVFSDAQGSV